MLHLIPPPLHRLLLRVAYRVRSRLRRMVKIRLRGVSVIAHDSAGRVLLVRHSYGSGWWTLPGGGCGRSEDPEAAARREMREELAVELSDCEKLSTHEEVISGAPHTAHVFAARLDGEPVPDGREIVAARMFVCDALPPELGQLTRARLALWLERSTRDRP